MKFWGKMRRFPITFWIFVLCLGAGSLGSEVNPDPHGYITYCPCMGRFGNQADHLLGSLAFAKAVNRTLVLPPWVEYRKGEIKSIQVPFNKYFKVDPILEYHRVITMEDFMGDLARKIWPLHKRISFCYMERKSLDQTNTKKDCNAKEGNPFGPFWDTFRINFIASEFFGPLHYDVHHSQVATKWKENYKAKDWPVLAFTGAPASFPVQSENRKLHRYIQWSESYEKKAQHFIKNTLPRGAYLGIHLRNGIDWVRACEHVKSSTNLFASPQCLGYKNEYGTLYDELCMPTRIQVVRQLKRIIKRTKLANPSNPIKSIFVASDNNHMIDDLSRDLIDMDVSLHKLETNDPHLDLAILGRANYFVGNCISSYSAFVIRERESRGFPSYFWAFPKSEVEHDDETTQHDEL